MSYKTLTLDEEAHTVAKIAASSEKMSLKDWVERAIYEALDTNGKRLTDSRPSYETRTEV